MIVRIILMIIILTIIIFQTKSANKESIIFVHLAFIQRGS